MTPSTFEVNQMKGSYLTAATLDAIFIRNLEMKGRLEVAVVLAWATRVVSDGVTVFAEVLVRSGVVGDSRSSICAFHDSIEANISSREIPVCSIYEMISIWSVAVTFG